MNSEFKLFYVNFDDVEDFIHKKTETKEFDSRISREMLHVIKEYKKIYNEVEQTIKIVFFIVLL